MTLLLVLAGVTGGALAGVGGTLLWYPHRVDAHEWRKVRLEATRVDELWRDLDHYRRLSARLEARLDHVLTDARVWVADLLDKVADRERRIAQLTGPRHLRRSPMPDYGRWAA